MLLAIALVGMALASSTAISGEALTDEQVRQVMIRESVSSYPGNCPCPWNSDAAGHRCGKRSAHTRPGGYAPLCFPHEISDEQVRAFREARDIKKL